MTSREPARCEAQRETYCAKTGEIIKKDGSCWFVRGAGVFKEKPTETDISNALGNLTSRGKDLLGGGASPAKPHPGPHLVEVLEDTVCEITQVRIEKGEGAWFVGGVGYFRKKPTDEDFKALLDDRRDS